MNSNLHIHVGIEETGINYENCERLYHNLAEEADRDIARMREYKGELNLQIVAHILGMWDFPEHRLGEKINSGWAIGYLKKRINGAFGTLQFWATIAHKDVSDIEYIKDRFLTRLEDTLNDAARIKEGW